jgi:DNA replicative helicase MCM subunit Mcm2 (Cdc46/Mcm family)
MASERIINYLLDQLEQRDYEIDVLKAEIIQIQSPKDKYKPFEGNDKRNSNYIDPTISKSELRPLVKLKEFMKTFKSLRGKEKDDVEEKRFIYELVKTGLFTEDEAKDYILKAIQNGQIYERRDGYYQST